jgi:hypothetical protein
MYYDVLVVVELEVVPEVVFFCTQGQGFSIVVTT